MGSYRPPAWASSSPLPAGAMILSQAVAGVTAATPRRTGGPLVLGDRRTSGLKQACRRVHHAIHEAAVQGTYATLAKIETLLGEPGHRARLSVDHRFVYVQVHDGAGGYLYELVPVFRARGRGWLGTPSTRATRGIGWVIALPSRRSHLLRDDGCVPLTIHRPISSPPAVFAQSQLANKSIEQAARGNPLKRGCGPLFMPKAFDNKGVVAMGWVARLFGADSKEERDGIRLDGARSYWEVEGPRSFTVLFVALRGWLPEGAVMYFEGGSPDAEIREFMDGYSIPEQSRVATGTIWPKPVVFHVLASEAALGELARIMERHAGPELAIHFHVYRQETVLLQWHDAFSAPLLLSGIIPREEVEVLACRMGGRFREVVEQAD